MREKHHISRSHILAYLFVAVLLCVALAFVFAPNTRASKAASAGTHEFTHASATSFSAAGGIISDNGKPYYLDISRDVVGTLIVESGTEITLCLNGKSLRFTGTTGPVIEVRNGGILNLYDCVGTGTIYGGKNTGAGLGGGVYVQAGGTFNMYGGVITGNTAAYGAGVEVEGGTFNMYGGKITGNTATEDGGGINVSTGGTVTIYDGEISGNSATNGGGIYYSNYSDSGSGISTLDIRGGSITENTATTGGGIYCPSTDEAILRMQGAVNITGNSGGNVLLAGTNVINIAGAFTDGTDNAQIGVTLDKASSTIATGWNVNYGNVSDYFVSDNSAYYIDFSGTNVVLSNRGSIDITNDIINWSVNGVRLDDGTIYFKDGVYYRTDPGNASDSKSVLNSIARYDNGNELTVTLSAINGDYTVSYSYNKESNNGAYIAVATIAAGSSNLLSISGSIDAAYGVNVISSSGTTIVISKTWYIAESDNNILDEQKSISRRNTVAFSIDGWTYGENVQIGTPRLKYGDATSSLTFTLVYNDVQIIAENAKESIDALGDYLNASMPAGRYVLTMYAPSVSISAGANWWDSSPHTAEECDAFAIDYTFTVAVAPIDIGISKDAETGYLNYDWKYNATDKASFFTEFEEALAENISFVDAYNEQEDRIGYWKENSVARGYYGDYIVTYNFLRLRDNSYYTHDSAVLLDNISAGTGGTYVVYFRITTKNHETLSTADDRYNYFFTVVVYEEIKLPAPIGSVIYTGSKIAPPLAASTVYEIILDDDDEYVSGGTHALTLTLLDPVHTRWANGLTTLGDNNESVRWEFEVAQAENRWVRIPNVIGWDYGLYNTTDNAILAVPKYGEPEDVVFSISKDEAGTDLVEGLEGFTVDELGAVSGEILKLIKDIPLGTYWLIAKVNSTDDYTGLEAAASFRISFTENYWVSPLSIVAWSNGEYNASKNKITAEAAAGKVLIIITDSKGKEYYNSATGVNELKSAPVGSYLLTATVEATDSYSALSGSITFNVFEAAGLAWWIWLIIIFGILIVILLIGLILVKSGTVSVVTEKMVVAMRTRADTDATIAAVKAGKIAAEAERIAEQSRLEAAAAADAIAADEGELEDEDVQPDEEEEDEDTIYEPDDNDVEIPSGAGFQKVFAANTTAGVEINYGKTVLSKLISSTDVVKNRYSEIKNYLLGYKKTRANMSRARESFYLGRKCYARIAMRGKTLCLYLALNPSDYAEKYKVEDVLSVKQYVDTPCLLRIRSDRALRYAKALVDALMTNIGAVAFDRKPENYAALFNSIQMLEKKRLLSYGVKKQSSNGKLPPRKAPNPAAKESAEAEKPVEEGAKAEAVEASPQTEEPKATETETVAPPESEEPKAAEETTATEPTPKKSTKSTTAAKSTKPKTTKSTKK